LARESGFLPQLESLLAPIDLRRNEQIHEQPRVVMPVDTVAQLRVLFDTGASAAPERLIFSVECLPHAGCQREVVLRGAGARMDGADTMVQQQPLVVIEVR